MGTITALLLSVFLFTGCSPAFVEQQKIVYEEEMFKDAETYQEKSEVLNEEFLKTLFSVDAGNEQDILLKLSLYATPGFAKNFEANTFPFLMAIKNREFIELKEFITIEGQYKIEETEVDAYEITSMVEYRQDEHLLQKKMKTVYAFINGEIKIVDLQEINMDIIDNTERPQ